jgi:hypothetical protein
MAVPAFAVEFPFSDFNRPEILTERDSAADSALKAGTGKSPDTAKEPAGLKSLVIRKSTPEFGEWASRFTLEYSDLSPFGPTFQLNQGFTIYYFGSHQFLRFHYRGAYDFNTGTESGPVVSRLQNPMVFYEYDFRAAHIGILAGWAHESNGQILQDTGDASAYRVVNSGKNGYDPQDYASMGWDYWWAGFAHNLGRLRYTAEYRFHVRQVSEWPIGDAFGGSVRGIEDTSFFDGARHRGIKAVDGLRAQATLMLVRHWSLYFSAAGVWPEIGYGAAEDYELRKIPLSFQIGLGKKLPVFLSYSRGRLSNPARFDAIMDYKVNLGFILPIVSNQGLNGCRWNPACAEGRANLGAIYRKLFR